MICGEATSTFECLCKACGVLVQSVHTLCRSSVLGVSLLLSVCVRPSEAQPTITNQGRSFHIALQTNQDYERPDLTELSLYITSDSGATGGVDIPALFFHRGFTVSPGGGTIIPLPPSAEIPDGDDETITSRSIVVDADRPVAVMAMSHKFRSSDALTALPLEALGSDYVVCCRANIGGTVPTCAEFTIAAPFDSTVVTLNPTAHTRMGRVPNVPYSILLNHNESYMVQGDWNLVGEDLTGTRIQSTKPIAVTSGHGRASTPFSFGTQNCLVEEIPPVTSLGTEFFVPKLFSRAGSYCRLVGAYDNTQVVINGSGPLHIPSQGYLDRPVDAPLHITSTRPLLVCLFVGSAQVSPLDTATRNCDPAMVVIAPREQFLSNYTVRTVSSPAFTEQYCTVVGVDSLLSAVLIDGRPLMGQSAQFGGSDFESITFPVSQDIHTVNSPSPVSLTAYGYGELDAYLFPGGIGAAQSSSVLTSDSILDFGRVSVGKSKDSVVRLLASSLGKQIVYSAILEGQDSAMFRGWPGQFPISIDANAKGAVTVSFAPQFRGDFTARLRIVSSSLDTISITLRGRGVQKFTSLVSCDTVRGSLDTTVIPLRMWSPIVGSAVDTIVLKLAYNETLLYPLDVSLGSAGPSGTKCELSRNDSGCTITVTRLNGVLEQGILVSLRVLVLLSDTLSSPIRIEGAVTNDSDVTIYTRDGLFLLDSLCGGPRSLIELVPPAQMTLLGSNPVSTDALVSYELPRQMELSLTLVSITRGTAYPLYAGTLPAGRYDTRLSASRFPDGAFYVVFRAGRYCQRQKVVFVR